MHTPTLSADAECVSVPDLHDGGTASLHCCGRQRYPHAHRETTGHPVYGCGRAGPLSAGAAFKATREGYTTSCEYTSLAIGEPCI